MFQKIQTMLNEASKKNFEQKASRRKLLSTGFGIALLAIGLKAKKTELQQDKYENHYSNSSYGA